MKIVPIKISGIYEIDKNKSLKRMKIEKMHKNI